MLSSTSLPKIATFTRLPCTILHDGTGLGCGIRGPASCGAANFGCRVTGVDLSPSLVDAAKYLTARYGPSECGTFQVCDALHLPFEDRAFDAVYLQYGS